jgi:hypothetical protein
MGRRADGGSGMIMFGRHMRTETWTDCRNVKDGWRSIDVQGQEVFIRTHPDCIDPTSPARMPQSKLVHSSSWRRGDRGHHRAAQSLTRTSASGSVAVAMVD